MECIFNLSCKQLYKKIFYYYLNTLVNHIFIFIVLFKLKIIIDILSNILSNNFN